MTKNSNNKKNTIIAKRTKIRELFMQMLFEMDAQKDFTEEKKAGYITKYMPDIKEKKQLEFFERLFKETTENMAAIDEKIEACSDNWKTSRMGRVDLAVLRLASCEIYYFDDIPDSVSANEAVDLAKKFGGDESRRFVNGVVGKLIKAKNE